MACISIVVSHNLELKWTSLELFVIILYKFVHNIEVQGKAKLVQAAVRSHIIT